jgi:type VI protein secretion system component Hcp
VWSAFAAWPRRRARSGAVEGGLGAMSQEEANQIAREAQRRRRLAGALKLALPTAAALGAGAAIAVAAIPGTDGTITGCYLTNTDSAPGLRIGQLRLVDPTLSPTLPGGGPNPAAVCLSDEAKISWSQSGPSGPQGPPGPAGQQGLPGANGAQVLLPAVQFGFDNSAGSMFLKLDGVSGEVKGGAFKDDFEISSFSFGDGSTHAASGGAGAGKTSFSSFTITKPLDKSSAQLELGALSGKFFKEADVFFARKAGKAHESKGQQDFLELKLENVLISSYKASGAGGGQVPTETLVLNGIKGEATFISGNSSYKILLKPQGAA